MASIPYVVRKMDTSIGEDGLSVALLSESLEGYELCSILQGQDEGTTIRNAIAIYKRNQSLIFTEFIVKDAVMDRYMTAEQITLLKDIGAVVLNGERHIVSDVTISLIPDQDEFFASITLDPDEE